MQLGTRWRAGEPPHASLPPAFAAAAREVESRLDPDALAGLRWTLTWRERLPWLELDDGTRIEPTAEGPRILPAED